WVLVQPFERRVLSYTPANPSGFQVEMGNIGQHYFTWRYMTNPGGLAGPATATPIAPVASNTPDPCATATPLPTSTGTPTTATNTPTATPITCTTPTATSDVQGVEITNFRQTGLTDTTFSFSFNTNLPATSYIRYGTTSGVYPNAVDIATSQTTAHAATLTGLTASTIYYFVIRVTSSVDAVNRFEDYFITMDPLGTPTPTDTPTPTAGPSPTPTTAPTRPPPPPIPTNTPGPSPTPPTPKPCTPTPQQPCSR
ncbi:MAG: fibronectin type III domain-containing protein, partial [Thermomicrobiales bacterium]